jgi:hypothetical protein
MKPLRLALIIVVFATAAAAEQFDRSAFYLRDIRASVRSLHGAQTPFTPEELWAGAALPDPDSYSIKLEPLKVGFVSRNFARTQLDDRKFGVLGVGFQEKADLDIGLNLGASTAFSFKDTNTVTTDLFGTPFTESSVRTMGMVQSLGGGESASTLKLTRTETSNLTVGLREKTRTQEDLELATGLAKEWGLNLKASRFTTNEGVTGVRGSSFNTSLTMPFSGGPATWTYAQARQEGNGVRSRTEKFTGALPLMIRGNKVTMAFGASHGDRNGVEARSKDFSVDLPFQLGGKDTKWAFATSYNDNYGKVSKSRALELMVPFSVSGSDVQWAFSQSYQNNVGAVVKSQNLGMKLPFRVFGGQAVAEHTYNFNYAKNVHTQQRKTFLSTPLKLLGNDYKLEYTIQGDDVGKGLLETRTTTLDIPFQVDGKAVPKTWSYVRSEGPVKDVATRGQKLDVEVPLAIGAMRGTAAHHGSFTYLNGTHTEVRDTTVSLPLKLWGKEIGFSHVIHGEDKGGGLAEIKTTTFTNPFSLFGREFGAEEVFTSVRQGGVYTSKVLGKLTAPMFGGRAAMHRQVVKTFTPASRGEQRQTAVTLPTIKLSKNLALRGLRHVSTDTVGVGGNNVTNLGMVMQPLDPLSLEAKYTINDGGMKAPTLTQTQWLGTWKMTHNLQLQGQLNTADVAGAPANSRKILELVRDRGDSLIGLRAALVAYGAPAGAPEDAHSVEITLGKPEKLALTAGFSEYDPKTRNSLANDAIVALALEHGRPEKLSFRWRYEDQPKRVAPAKGFDLAMPALGGTFQLTYVANPMTADGKAVRQAEQYDASLERKLGDLVSLKLGYRYLDSRVPDLVDQYVRVQLDGGEVDGWGKIALAYQTGDFCKPDPGKKVPPGSALDLSFTRSWDETGQMTLNLMRRTAPKNQFTDGLVEGRLEYKMLFR